MRQRSLKHILTLLLVLYPILVNLLLMVSLTGYSLLDLAPFWNDELLHWHQPLTFSVAGFNGGYYTVSETPAPLGELAHFYAWGPFSPALYGIFASVLPWSLNALAGVNIGLFLLATLAFIYLAKLDIWQQFALAFALGTFIPLMTLLHSSMLQLLHLSIALVLAGLFVRLLRGPVSWRFVLFTGLFIMFAGLHRPNWSLLILPLLFLGQRRITPLSGIGTLILSAGLIVATFVLFIWTSAPYPGTKASLVLSGLSDPLAMMNQFINFFEQSMQLLLDGFPHVVGLRLQVICILLTATILLLHIARKRYRSRHALTDTQRDLLREMFLHLVNIGVPLLLNITIQNLIDSRDYRVMAPHFLLSLLILLAHRRRLLFGAVIASTILIIPLALSFYMDLSIVSTINGDRVRAEYNHYASQFTQVIAYDADTESAWCNTVTVAPLYILGNPEPGMLLAIPPGLGISWVHPDIIPNRFKAQYLILNDDAVNQWQDRLNIAPLMEVYEGALYRNLDADCPA